MPKPIRRATPSRSRRRTGRPAGLGAHWHQPGAAPAPDGKPTLLDVIARVRPADADQLHRFVHRVLGLNVVRQTLEPASTPPMDYLTDCFFEPTRNLSRPDDDEPTSDAVVWACRGGGKTMLGAVATLLDMIFKPGIQVRILGGSLEQARKMYDHLLSLLDRPALRLGGGVLASPPTQRRLVMHNGSVVEILAGSQRSVRGTRVHKLRCDEVEQLDPELWQAAQLVTRSGWCGDQYVHGRVEALSTMHRPFGLMSQLVENAQQHQGTRVYRWNGLDVAARCEPARACDPCPLEPDCRGRAKQADGFISIDDLMAQHRRTSDITWQAEMLCLRPSTRDLVYPSFDVDRHVAAIDVRANADHRNTHGNDADQQTITVAGMDFGLRCPTVYLWARLNGRGESRLLWIVDEYVASDLTVDQNVAAIEARNQQRNHGVVQWVGVDPAGQQRSSHSGLSDITVLRSAGWRIRSRRSGIREGIERVRHLLDRDRLRIDPRCRQLIQAISTYHFKPDQPEREQPVKDGPDHACDALRYLVINLESGSGQTKRRSYLA